MTDHDPSDPTAPAVPADLDGVEARLDHRLDDDARDWLADARDRIAADASQVRVLFPAVSRRVGRGPLDAGADGDDPFTWHRDDAGRALLLAAVDPSARPSELRDCYTHGDARERRGVLRALEVVDVDDAVTAELVDDALRTNDVRLVAAALGPAGVAVLDDHGFAQAVLKAVFVELDLDRIAGIPGRVTPELSRMMADFVHERVAAGRGVPASVWTVIDRHPPADRLAAIEAERDHEDPHRAAAAEAALGARS